MEKNRFKDLLFEMLNEHGEDELGMENVVLHDREDLLLVQTTDGSEFQIKVKQVEGRR